MLKPLRLETLFLLRNFWLRFILQINTLLCGLSMAGPQHKGHPSIYSSLQGQGGAGVYFQGSWGQRRGTPWIGLESIKGYNQSSTHPHTDSGEPHCSHGADR
ncbi:hypothetical protein ILYODFUR_028271 [Ilyodon furcidens]|uniref:Secreted protein n=1 Tax=Ilyodon furcidens TaxID=33524 RepID=A0ABV0UMS2_9TELE